MVEICTENDVSFSPMTTGPPNELSHSKMVSAGDPLTRRE
jgi:hypothetical protein